MSIWNYFSRKESTAICNACKKELSLGSVERKKQTATGLKKHFQSKHISEYNEYIGDVENISQAKKAKLDASSKQARVVDNLIQQSLPEVIDKSNYWPDDHPVAKKIDKQIMDFIAVDLLPYNVVEGKGFKRFSFANPDVPPKYRLKSEKFFRTQMMPDTYTKVHAKVTSFLAKAKWLSITSDIWTNANATCSLLSFTAHIIDGSHRLKVILAARVLEEAHTGMNIAENLVEVAKSYDIVDKVHLAVRDNAKNMCAAMRIGGFTSIGCVAHTLQLIIHDTFLKQETVSELLIKCRKIVGHFNRSEPSKKYLKMYQDLLHLPNHKLLQDIPTRWNSSYIMMGRLLEQKSAINMFSLERGSITSLTAEEWAYVAKVLPVLKVFLDATLEICADDSCISVVIPLIAMIAKKLEAACTDDCEVSHLKSSMLTSLTTRFAHIKRDEYMISTFLDPRFKGQYFTMDEIAEIKKKIIGILRTDDDSSTNSDSSFDEPVLISNSSDLWSRMMLLQRIIEPK